MTFFPALGISAFMYFDVHPDWFFIPGGSAPQGLWHIVERDGRKPLERGDWIIVCPPLNAAAHQQLFAENPPNGEACASKRSMKQVAAIPGDRVIVNFPYVDTPLRVVEAIDVDAHGDALPRPFDGIYTVDENTYWVLSQHPRSADSRYYGAISLTDIETRVKPVWTFP